MEKIKQLIEHYEKEFDYYDKQANEHKNCNEALYEWFNGSRNQIRNFIYQLNKLNSLPQGEAPSVTDNEGKEKDLFPKSCYYCQKVQMVSNCKGCPHFPK